MNYNFILVLFFSSLSLTSSSTNFNIYEAVFHYQNFNVDNLKDFPNFQSLKNTQTPIFEKAFGDLLGTNLQYIDLVDVELSGLSKTSLDTVVFTGQIYINKNINRNDIIEKINKNGPLSIFKLSAPSKVSPLSKGRVKNNNDAYLFEDQLLTFGTCQNGGILLPNKTCECKDYFKGSRCEQIVCLNSGISTLGGRCICPPGFISAHCEPLTLTQPTQYSFDFTDKSFIYVINLRDSMSEDIQYIVTNTNINYSNFTVNYRNYILTLYVTNTNLNYNFVKTVTYDFLDDFINALRAITVTYGDVEQPTLSAINDALSTQQFIKPRSNIFVFCDSPSSMSTGFNLTQGLTNSLEYDITLSLINWNIRIYFSKTSTNLYPTNVNSDGYLVYDRLASSSFGQLFDFGSTKGNVKNFTAQVIPYLLPIDIIDRRLKISYKNFMLTLNTSDDSVNLVIVGEGQISNHTPIISLSSISIYTISKKDYGMINFICSGTINYYIFASVKNIIVPGFTTITQGNHAEVDIYSTSLVNEFPMKAVMYGYNIISSTMELQPTSQNGVVNNLGTSSLRNNQQEGMFGFVFSNTISTCSVGYNVIAIEYTDSTTNLNYKRIFPTLCQNAYDLSQNQLTCQNGGTINGQGNGCTCTSDYTGNVCETPLCYNGGSINPYPTGTTNQCTCINGFYGNHCEKDSCTGGLNPKFDISHRTLSIVMANVSSQAYLAPYIANAIEQFMNVSSQSNPNYITEFTLTFYSVINVPGMNNLETVVTSRYDSSDKLVDAIRTNRYPFSASDTQNSLNGLVDGLAFPVTYNRKRILFWVVDQNTMNDSVDTYYLNAQISAIATETPVNIIYAQPFNPDSSSSSSICKSGNNKVDSKLSQIAYKTGGLIFDLCTFSDLNNIQKLFTTFGQFNYRVENILQKNLQQCNNNQVGTVSFSSNGKKFVLVNSNTQNSVTLSITDTKGIPQQVNDSISKVPSIFLYDISTLQKNTNYVFGITSQNQGSCSFTIMEESDIVLFLGFSNSVAVNYNETILDFGIPYHPVVHLSTAFQNQPTIELSDEMKYATGAYDSTGFLRSSSCSYDYFYETPYACKVKNSPFYLTATIKANISSTETFTAQRSILSFCNGPLLDQCLNGGNFYNNTCVCPFNYMGQYCEKPLCYNGGTSIQNQCQCPKNYFGTFCQYIGCDALDYKTLGDVNKFSYNTVIFVVENTNDAVNMNKDLTSNFDSFMELLLGVNSPKEFVLITVDDKSSKNIIVTPDPSKFVDVVVKTLSVPSSSSSGQDVKTLSGIEAALQYSLYKPTIIYVFTTNGAADKGNVMTTASKIGESFVQINYIYVPKTNIINPTISTSTKYMYTQLLAHGSGGRSIALNYGTELSAFINGYLHYTTQEDGIVEDKYVSDSSTSPTKVFFPVENQTEWFTISLLGKGVNNKNALKIYNGNGQIVTPIQYEILISSSGYVVVKILKLSFTENYHGQWKVEGQTSSGSLRIQVRVSSSVFVKVGFSGTQTNDFVSRLPGNSPTSPTTQNYITAHLPYNMYMSSNVILESARVYSVVMDSEKTTDISMFNFYLRNPDTCSFQYVSPQVTIPKLSIPSIMMVQINGQDQYAQSIQRLFFYTPSQVNCINGVLDGNGFCKCNSPDFTGIDCNTIICKNGGTSDGSVCYCPPGYWGDLCEKILGSVPIIPTTPSPLQIEQYFGLFYCDKSTTGVTVIENQLEIINAFFNYNGNVSTSLLIESQGQDSLVNNYTVVQPKDITTFNVEIENVRNQKAILGDITFLNLVIGNQAQMNLSNTNIYTNNPGMIFFVNSNPLGLDDTLRILNNIKQSQNNGLQILAIVFDQNYMNVGTGLTGNGNSVYLYQSGITQISDVVTWIYQKLSSP